MRKCNKALICLAFGALGLLIALVLGAFRDRGPRISGRSLEAWLDILNEAPADSQQANAATAAIQALGTNALAYGLRWIQEPPSEPVWSEEDVPSRCFNAIDVFEALGPHAAPAIPTLVEIACSDREGSGRALMCLAAMGPEGIPALLGIATNTSVPPYLQHQAIVALERFGPNGSAALPTLASRLRDPDPEIALAAMDTLLRLNTKSPEMLPALTNELEDPRAVMRIRAVMGISQYGPDARQVLPALARKLDDPERRVRFLAAGVLHKIAPDIYTNEPIRHRGPRGVPPQALTNAPPPGN